MRGGVEGLAGVQGEDVVGPSPLELPLRHEQGRAGVGAGEGPLLPVADHSVPCEHFRDALGVKPVRTPVAIFGSLGVCIYVPASRHWLISYSPIHLT